MGSDLSFNRTDLDQEALHESVEREVTGIMRKTNDPKEEVYARTEKGHAIERYLIEELNYVDNPMLWHDVISPTGTMVECKAIDAKYCNDYIIEADPYTNNLKKWTNSYSGPKAYNQARYVVVFSNKDTQYDYYATYDLETQTTVDLGSL